jgi:hypothetical protein
LERLRASLVRLFQVRHILTHELPSRPVYEPGEIDVFLLSAIEFVRASQQTFATLLYGNYEFKPRDMAVQAKGSETRREDELRSILDRLKDLVDTDALRRSQDSWKEYQEQQALFRSHALAGGSMQPVIYVQELTRLAGLRIEELTWWLEREDGEI